MDLTTGQNLIKQKKFSEALNFFLKLNDQYFNNFEINFYLGRVYSELQNYSSSIKHYKNSIEINTNSIGSFINLAILYQNIGDKNNSTTYFKKVIKANKKFIQAYYGLYTLDKNLLGDEDYNYLERLLENENLNLNNNGLINFLLSKREKDKKNQEKELFYIKEYHKKTYNSNFTYNNQSQFYYNTFLKKNYNKIVFKNENNFNSYINPIFIIGLPRSGSTLIESLLTSSEKKLKTFGESNYFNMAILNQINHIIFNSNFDIDKYDYIIDLDEIKKYIEARYSLEENFNKKNSYQFVDKSLENIFNIETIIKIFPNAKFIHTFRNSKDAKLAIYFSMLSELSWSHSLKDIDNYFKIYQKVITYFKKKFPENILDIDLNLLTENPYETSKKIFEFNNLKWNKNILNFYKRKDLFTKTLSSSQIRKKISGKNKSNYENYYHLLK